MTYESLGLNFPKFVSKSRGANRSPLRSTPEEARTCQCRLKPSLLRKQDSNTQVKVSGAAVDPYSSHEQPASTEEALKLVKFTSDQTAEARRNNEIVMSHDASLAHGSHLQRSSMLESLPKTMQADVPSDSNSSHKSLGKTQSVDSFTEDYTLHAKHVSAYK